jgi:hypothetical protein
MAEPSALTTKNERLESLQLVFISHRPLTRNFRAQIVTRLGKKNTRPPMHGLTDGAQLQTLTPALEQNLPHLFRFPDFELWIVLQPCLRFGSGIDQ